MVKQKCTAADDRLISPCLVFILRDVTALLLTLLFGADASGWEEVERTDGVVIAARDVKGSPHRELKATISAPLPVEALCDAAFGPAGFDASEPTLKTRRLIKDAPDERTHYDQM